MAVTGIIAIFGIMIIGMYFAISSGNKAAEEEKNITINAINTISNVVSDKNLTSSFQKTSIDYIDDKKLTFRAKKVDNTITVVLGDILGYQRNVKLLMQKIKDKNMKVVEIVQVLNPESLNEEIKLTIEN